MAFQPVDFFKLALELHQAATKTSSEASRRACVSRAYYSAFLEARTKASINATSVSVHQDVIRYYQTNAQAHPSIGNSLKDLHEDRKDADYDLKKTCSAQISGKALTQASKVLRHFGALPQNAPKT